MKQKLIILPTLVLVMAAGYVTAIKKDTLAKEKMLSMINLEALAGDEWDIGGGGMDPGESGGGTFPCKTKDFPTYSQTEQDCDIFGKVQKMPLRITETYSCEGTGTGTCYKGSIYRYVTCTGSITEENMRYSANCSK